ncbi:MAG: DUF1778 domain-containing protein [Steroidobacteraceae bacterium]|jgi:uncharacterized protein (DUF1778 family)|nr:DUF1778 domain-containing protein [Steroidobacteraceae bacterium]
MTTDTAAVERERITARVPRELRERLEEAAGRTGATLNQFLVQAAVEKADAILEREQVTRLSARDVERLLAMLDAPPRPPGDRLQRALDAHQKASGGDPDRAADRAPRSQDV